MRMLVDQIPNWFHTMDADSNGTVDQNELTMSEARFESLCNLPEEMLEAQFFAGADTDQDGNVTLAEQKEGIKEL
jgi:Ca2+-binding EF-hand superfamily protein